MDRIPICRFDRFYVWRPSERKQRFVNDIRKAYEYIGFVALKGHFLDDQLVDKLYAEVKNFFKLPVEVKSVMKFPESAAKEDMYLLERKVPREKRRRFKRILAFWTICGG
jgi:isopenicillin N synthase-like dioxygenase